LEKQGQDLVDAIIDKYQMDIDKAKSFNDAANRILNSHKSQFKQRSKLAQILDSLRFVALRQRVLQCQKIKFRNRARLSITLSASYQWPPIIGISLKWASMFMLLL